MSKIESVCLLTGKGYVPQWLAQAFNNVVDNTDAEFSLIINSGNKKEQKHQRDQKKEGIKRPVYWLKNKIEPNPQSYVSLGEIDALSNAEIINCSVQPVTEGIGVEYPSNIVTQVQECDLGFHHMVGVLKGNILTAPQHGVIGYHHGDIRKYRGTPNAVWQYLNDEPTVGVTLQRYSEKLDAGEILSFNTVDIRDRHKLVDILSKQHEISVPMITEGIIRLEDREFEPEEVSDDELGELYTSEEYTMITRIRFLIKSRLKYITK